MATKNLLAAAREAAKIILCDGGPSTVEGIAQVFLSEVRDACLTVVPAEGSNPSQGAIKAAEIITGGVYGNGRRYPTAYGEKSIEGIARIIDETIREAWELRYFMVYQHNGDGTYCGHNAYKVLDRGEITELVGPHDRVFEITEGEYNAIPVPYRN